MSNTEKLKRRIRGKMVGIKNGTITPKESGLGTLFKLMKDYDEVQYEGLIRDYKQVLLKLND